MTTRRDPAVWPARASIAAIRAAALAVAVAVGVAVWAAGCDQRRIADMDEVYYAWDDRAVLCGAGVDTHNRNDLENIDEGIARAAERGEVLVLFGHEPGDDVPVARIADILALGDARAVPFVSFADLAAGPPASDARAGVALTFDDSFIDAWFSIRDLLRDHGARATFFVTRVDRLSDTRIEMLHALAADGHAIESHGLRHLDAVAYAAEHGVQAYLDDEFLPGLEALRERGFSPTSFAYPFGTRTAALDRALLEHVRLLRSIAWTHPYPLVRDPCPR